MAESAAAGPSTVGPAEVWKRLRRPGHDDRVRVLVGRHMGDSGMHTRRTAVAVATLALTATSVATATLATANATAAGADRRPLPPAVLKSTLPSGFRDDT